MSTPSRLGRYSVRRRIGAGAFATVWLAHDDHLDSPVAIKVLADNWSEDLHARQRFVEEGRFLRRVESPHVVSVYDAGELPDGRPFLVMSYADQGTLADRLALEPPTIGQALHVLDQVGTGLHALHERGVLHRDVKPGNVLFRGDVRNGVVHVSAMLGDLGLGKTMDVSSRLTVIGGTPSSVAPEQAQGEQLDARADQFSLAALAYLLLSGRAPYAHSSLGAATDPGPPPSLDGAVPPETEAVLLKALARDREERYADVPAFVAALTASLPDHPVGPLAAISIDPGTDDDVEPETAPEVLADALAEAEGVSRKGLGLVAGAVAVLVGLVTGFIGWQLGDTHQVLQDSKGTIELTVPEEWAQAVETEQWTPPGSEDSFAALSAGTSVGWNANDDPGHGVFAALLPGEALPATVPQHPECEEARPLEEDSRDGDDYVTVEFTGCADGGVTVERVVQVIANRLLWVQVRAADRGAANEVLDSVELSGM